MAFGAKKPALAGVGMDRLAAVAGAPRQASMATADAAVSVRPPPPRQPDPSRIRPRQIEETAAQRKRRLAAKTVNFTATIIARIIIIAGAGWWVWQQYQFTGQVHRGIAIGVFVMLGDLGRVIMKATEPGAK